MRANVKRLSMVTLPSNARTWRLAGFLIGALVAMQAIAGDPQKMVGTEPDKVAIQGYDTVAYFTEGQPMKGKPEFSYSWNDARWHFFNAAQRDLFVADPERYAPQFGGHCSMALSRGEVKTIDPEAWAIVNGKLYLSYSKPGIEKFRTNAAENIKKAEKNWAKAQTQ